MSDEKERALPSPQVCVDPGYIDTNRMGLPKGDWKIELPVDSFYDFIHKPEENKQSFEDLVKSLAEGGFMTEQPPTIIGTKEAIDKTMEYLGEIPPIPPTLQSTFDEVGNKIMTSLGVPMDMISVGPNRNGRTYSSDAINKAINSNGDMEAVRNEMSILKEKNDKYLELIQVQANSLKEKDLIIAKLRDALDNALNSQLNNMTGQLEQTPPPKPNTSDLLEDAGKMFGYGRK